ncbi:CBL-interacting serine/threonine-protein kinase 6 [Prunus yedoensis var. nudiflora]|uniref:non-specific serine/threonine protein kinase n=1 Tax=Prunus yedoensis var. nudiflora TaxID=2094558 RepID=A0A314ULQ8_PRUYE|nr:CBL-interacting serine/threonine-protein kinase 6 [Prunus yedoensis var. nudiflora]
MRGASLHKPELSARAKRCIGGRNCHRKHVEDGQRWLLVAPRQVRAGPSSGSRYFRQGLPCQELEEREKCGHESGGEREGNQSWDDGADQEREISVMRMVKHPNIVELHEVMASKSKIYFAMDLVRGGELFAKIAKGRLKEDVARVYFQQLISAIDFCHSRGVYHRDLKPENLLLDEDGKLKVTDFGLSAFSEHLKQDGLLHTTCGTPAYVAPEVIGKKGYDGAKADLWSCGVVLYVLLAGFLPFQDDNLVAMYRKIYRGDFKCPPWFSPEARRLVTKLLDPNPSTRITISKVMDSSWFKKSVPKMVRTKQEQEFDETSEKITWKQTETLNAFHIISLSEGFDLSPLFEEKKREEKEELRFATTLPASSVISTLEEVAKAGKFRIKKSDSMVRLQGEESGRKGKLAIAAEIFAVTPSFLVVEVKKDSGDTLEYNQFCSKELRPALKDIVWTPQVDGSTQRLLD